MLQLFTNAAAFQKAFKGRTAQLSSEVVLEEGCGVSARKFCTLHDCTKFVMLDAK